jgi:hypothetical protein
VTNSRFVGERDAHNTTADVFLRRGALGLVADGLGDVESAVSEFRESFRSATSCGGAGSERA